MNAVGFLTVVHIALRLSNAFLTDDQKTALLHAVFWAASVMVWQIIWFVLVPFDLRNETPAAYFGLLWPVAIALFHVVQSNHRSEEHVKNIQRTAMHWDSNAIIGLCFTVATLLVDARVRNNRHLTVMLLSPIILCLCLIVSMPFLDGGCIEGVFVRMLHKLRSTPPLASCSPGSPSASCTRR